MKLTVSRDAGADGWEFILNRLKGVTVNITLNEPLAGPVAEIRGDWVITGKILGASDEAVALGELFFNDRFSDLQEAVLYELIETIEYA